MFWQCKEKSGSLIQFSFNPQLAAMPVDDALNTGQSDPGAGERQKPTPKI